MWVWIFALPVFYPVYPQFYKQSRARKATVFRGLGANIPLFPIRRRYFIRNCIICDRIVAISALNMFARFYPQKPEACPQALPLSFSIGFTHWLYE